MFNLYLFTATFTEPQQLRELWDQVPEEARGYALTLKALKWYTNCEREQVVEDMHEARFFWKGGEASWQAFQVFNGQRHQRHFRAVLICGQEAVRGFQRQEVRSKGKPSTLMLFESMLNNESEGLAKEDLPAVEIQPWHDAADQPVYWQWLKVVPGRIDQRGDT